MSGIFTNYRRENSAGWTGQLAERLGGQIGLRSLLKGKPSEPSTGFVKAPDKHDAFISYSRKDEVFANMLEKVLEAYVPPKSLMVPRQYLDIFRDKEDFTGNEYICALEEHLHSSAKLIVLCSPSARQSSYVNDEIQRFAKAKGPEHIIPLLIAGLANNEVSPEQEHEKAFPDALLEHMAMPLAADYRRFDVRHDKVNKGDFEGAWYTVLANLYGVSRRKIEQRDKQRRRAKGIQTSIFAATFCAVVAFGAWQLHEVHRTESIELATESAKASDQGIYDRAMRLAVLAARGTWLAKPTPEALAELSRAAHTSPQLSKLEGHGSSVTSAFFSPDGTKIITASKDKTARLWSTTTWKELATLLGHDDPVTIARFSPDGRQIITASEDQTARIWDATTRKSLTTFKGHNKTVHFAAFSPDGHQIITASEDHTARIWDAITGETLATLIDHKNPVTVAAFSPDGRQIVAASEDKTVRLWSTDTGKPLAIFTGHTGAVSSVAFSPDGTKVVTASEDKTARIWAATTGKSLATLESHEGPVSSAVFSPDNTKVATASVVDHKAHLWDAVTGKSLATLTGHTQPVRSVAFSPDGRQLVTTSEDQTARLWDTATGKTLATLAAHEGPVSSAVFNADSTKVVTTTLGDRTARLWDTVTGNPLATLRGHTQPVRSVAFSPDGRQLVTTSEDQTARLWDVHWLVEDHSQPLMQTVCQKKLIGARHLTEADTQVSPILKGRVGEDVCDPPSFLSRIAQTVGFNNLYAQVEVPTDAIGSDHASLYQKN